MKTNFQNKLLGIILGTAVGDAVGLPAENLRAKTIAKLGWQEWKHRFFFGKGMTSDDTEHTLFVYQALIAHADNVESFKKTMAWKLRLWLLGIPVGIGFGTLRAILKLWIFVPLSKSGIYTAGNGPAMRCAVIGAYFRNDKDKIYEYTKASTELTHTDPRALTGALAISYTSAIAVSNDSRKPDTKEIIEMLHGIDADDIEWQAIVNKMDASFASNHTVAEFAEVLDLRDRVTGYIYHTVPIAIYAWLKHYGDFRATLTSVLNLGGDTDTVGAIAGGLAGATVGEDGIPKEWIDNILEYPRSVNVLRQVADKLAVENSDRKPVKYFWPAIIPRNVLMALIVFGHIALRALPVSLRRLMKI